jgi:hypothetical protein
MKALKTVDFCETYRGRETVEALKGVSLLISKSELFAACG